MCVTWPPQVWNFLRVMGVPTNKLHACGYISIGCEPCTRPVLPNQHEREGRWWWEDATGERGAGVCVCVDGGDVGGQGPGSRMQPRNEPGQHQQGHGPGIAAGSPLCCVFGTSSFTV